MHARVVRPEREPIRRWPVERDVGGDLVARERIFRITVASVHVRNFSTNHARSIVIGQANASVCGFGALDTGTDHRFVRNARCFRGGIVIAFRITATASR